MADGWQEKIIHDFTGGNDGAVGSLGLLLIDSTGSIYGVTELGGAYGAGTVFKLFSSGDTWNLITLYAFRGQPDAAFPYGGLIADANGNLYGTTYFGGANGAGTVFKVAPGPKHWRLERHGAVQLSRRHRRRFADQHAGLRRSRESLRHNFGGWRSGLRLWRGIRTKSEWRWRRN